MIIPEIIMDIYIEPLVGPPAQKPCLVVIAPAFEIGNCFGCGHPAAQQRNVRRHNTCNFIFQSLDAEIRRILHFDIQTGPQGAVHFRQGPRPQTMEGQKNHELGRADIGILARWITIAQQLYHTAGSRHGLTNIKALPCRVLRPHRDIIQCKHLSGNPRSKRVGRHFPLNQPQRTDDIQQRLSRMGRHFMTVKHQLHSVSSYSYLLPSMTLSNHITAMGEIYLPMIKKPAAKLRLGSRPFPAVRGKVCPYRKRIPHVFLSKVYQLLAE